MYVIHCKLLLFAYMFQINYSNFFIHQQVVDKIKQSIKYKIKEKV